MTNAPSTPPGSGLSASPEPETVPPFDEGGWLNGGGYVIPASTMRPAPELTPEQLAVYQRLAAFLRSQ